MSNPAAARQFTPLSKAHLTELKKLRQKKFRQQERLTLVEGKNLIEQLISNGIQPLELIVSEHANLGDLLSRVVCPVWSAGNAALSMLTETETPQQVVGVYRTAQKELTKYQFILYLDGIRDPGNLGTIFRTTAAFGLDGIVLSPDCCDIFNPKVIRASLGSVFWLPCRIEAANWLSQQTAAKIGLKAQATHTLRSVLKQVSPPFILAIGSEGSGLNPAVEQALDTLAAIPIRSEMESLNAAVTAGIAIYETLRKHLSLT